MAEWSSDWGSRWHWPVRVGVLPDSGGFDLASSLRDARSIRRLHASLEDFRGDRPFDLLLLDQAPSRAESQLLKGKAAGIAIFAPSRVFTTGVLEKLRADSQAGFVIGLDVRRSDPSGFLDEFLTRQSHDEPLGKILAEMRGKWRFTYAASRSAQANITLSNTLPTILDQAETASRNYNFGIGRDAYSSFGFERMALPGFSGETVAPGIVQDISAAVKVGLDYQYEARSATGTAAISRAANAANSGPSVRYPDVTIFTRGAGNRLGDRLNDSDALGAGEDYVLEFAFRMQPQGITHETEIPPIKAKVTSKSNLLVALSAEPGCDVAIPEPLQKISIDVTGDSSAARFVFTAKGPIGGDACLAVRVYGRFNLVEHLIVSLAVRPRREIVKRAQQILQSNGFTKYAGVLSDAVMPSALTIDVAQHNGARTLTVAMPEDKSLILHVHPSFSDADLERNLGAIRDCWLDIALDTFNASLEPTSTRAGRSAIRRLAEAGRDLWTLVFESGPPAGALRALGNALRADPPPRGAKISVTLQANARDFVLPWQLLYDRDIDEGEEPDVEGFWGVRYLVEQHVAVDAMRPEDDAGRADTTPSIAMFVDGSIAQSKAQHQHLTALSAAQSPQIGFDRLETRKELLARLDDPSDALYYFFCHGLAGTPYSQWAEELRTRINQVITANGAGVDIARQLSALLGTSKLDGSDTALKLTRNTIKLKELLSKGPVFANDPIIFLNMCESAVLYPSVTQSFVSCFMNGFAGAVIGTECLVPPILADQLGCAVLADLFAERGAGTALLEARRTLLAKYGNPLGLAYALWGRSEATLWGIGKATEVPIG